MIVGIEVGGTFTDLVLADAEGQLRVHKLPSTPHDPSEAAIQGLKELLADAGAQACDVQELLHGSTIAANALIQRRGARTALITTRGFRDVLFIQRQDRTTVYDMFYVKPAPLVSRDFVFELNERMGADGEPITSLDETQALALADELVALGVESVAVCLLHAYANAAHELQLMNILADRAPNLRVSLSSQVAPEHREYERTSTTVIDAFVGPAVERYLQHYGEQAQALGYARTALIMQSNGGVVPLDRARRLAAGMFVSGPAAAVTAATHVANGADCPDVISVDVGGTSCDVCLIAGGAPRTTGKGSAEFSVDGLPLNVVMTDIATIGAGGGSIAHVDRGGMLQVGPQSAGAAPGPACYGHGGEAFCLTDAMLLLGLLDPERPLPGDIRLAPALAIAAAQPLCEHFGLTPQDLAAQVYRIAVANMAQAMRRVSVTRGFDPRSFALLPCGGAGPLVATALADEVGVDAILLPPHPGILSAFGLAVADVRMDYVKADGAITVKSETCNDIANRLTALRQDAETEFTQLGYDSGVLEFQFTADVRYLGQGYELRVELAEADFSPSGLGAFLDRFHTQHEQHFGYCARQRAVEIITLRLTARIKRQAPTIQAASDTAKRRLPARELRLGDIPESYQVIEREAMQPHCVHKGPIVIMESTTSTPVPPHWSAQRLADGTIRLSRGERA